MQVLDITSSDFGATYNASCRISNCALVNGYDSEIDRLTTEVADLSAAFLQLPEATLAKYDASNSNGERGVTYRLKTRTVDYVPFYEVRRHLMVGDDIEPDNPLAAFRKYNRRRENIHIEEADFQELVPLAVKLCRAVERATVHVYEETAKSMGLPSGYWAARLAWGDHALRSLHYDPIEGEFSEGTIDGLDVYGTTIDGVRVLEGVHDGQRRKQVIRASPHKDINMVAALLRANQPGFVMQQRDGELYRHTAEKGTMLLNAGHLAEHETAYSYPGGIDHTWRAGVHWVECENRTEPRDLVVAFMHFKEPDPVRVMPNYRDPDVLRAFPDTTETQALTDVLIKRRYVPRARVSEERTKARAAVEAIPARKLFDQLVEYETRHGLDRTGEARLLPFAHQADELFELWEEESRK